MKNIRKSILIFLSVCAVFYAMLIFGAIAGSKSCAEILSVISNKTEFLNISRDTATAPADNATAENTQYSSRLSRGMKLLREIKSQSLVELYDGSTVVIKNPLGKDLQDLNEVGISKSPFGQHYYEKALLMAPKVERVFFPGNEDHRNASTRYLNQ